MLIVVSSLIFIFSTFGILLVLLLYPLAIWIIPLIKEKKAIKYYSVHPPLSLVTVVHNAEDVIADKIKNFLSLNYPSDNCEIIIFSDGSTDETENRVKPFIGDKKVYFLSSSDHEGKIAGINKSVQN